MPDQDFERAFATLAHAELEQRVPGLIPYLIGFQVLDKDDDEQRAAGLFGFKVGDQWYYAPVFWLNGNLVGFELLYIVSQDLFVPLQEAWVNYVTNRRPYIFGEPEKKSPTELGVMTPDFTDFGRSPNTVKYAWNLMVKAPNDPKYAEYVKRANLDAVLSRAELRTVEAFLRTMSKSANFAEAVYSKYAKETIARAVREAVHASRRAGKPKSATVKAAEVYVTIDDTPADLTVNERETLMRGNAVVRDKRAAEDVSQVYEVSHSVSFQKPNDSGLYSVYMKNGKTKDCVVLVNPQTIGTGYPGHNVTEVVALDDRSFTQTKGNNVIVKQPVAQPDWPSVYDKCKSLSALSVGDVAMMITPEKRGSVPFVVLRKVTDSTGETLLCVKQMQDVFSGKDTGYPVAVARTDPKRPDYFTVDTGQKCTAGQEKLPDGYMDYKCRGEHIRVIEGTYEPTLTDGTTIVGRDAAKAFILKADATVEPAKSCGQWSSLQTAEQSDIDSWLFSKGLSKMSLSYDGGEEVEVQVGSRKKRAGRGPMVKTLIVDYGLAEKDARMLLDRVRKEKKATVFVKQAQPGLLTTGAVPQYSEMYNAPMVTTQEETAVMPSPHMNEEPPEIDVQTQQLVQQAASKGQKDVLDVAALTGLARSAGTEDRINDYIKDAIVGNDRIGRMLFMFYWHNDLFASRYGSTDLSELEDLLRETFKSTGDVILFLKQKAIEPESIASGEILSV